MRAEILLVQKETGIVVEIRLMTPSYQAALVNLQIWSDRFIPLLKPLVVFDFNLNGSRYLCVENSDRDVR